MTQPDKPPIVEYGTPKSSQRPGTEPVLKFLYIVGGTALIVSILFAVLNHLRDQGSGTSKCAVNLKQIGQAMLLYSIEHSGNYPDTIAGILEQGVTTSEFICPDGNDTPAKLGPSTRATAANVMSGGHMSYAYLGKGFTQNAPANAVMVYEPMANHQNQGMYVLFGDGHVEWLDAKQATWTLSEINGGHNPPRPDPSTRPTTQSH